MAISLELILVGFAEFFGDVSVVFSPISWPVFIYLAGLTRHESENMAFFCAIFWENTLQVISRKISLLCEKFTAPRSQIPEQNQLRMRPNFIVFFVSVFGYSSTDVCTT